MQTVSERIRWARETVAGITTRQLAAIIGKSPAYVSSLENGRFAPGGAALVALAEALGCPAAWLITGTGEVPAPEHVLAAVRASAAAAGVELAAEDPAATDPDTLVDTTSPEDEADDLTTNRNGDPGLKAAAG